MNRRSFIKKSIYTVAGVGLTTGLYSWRVEPYWLEFVRVKMPIKNLPKHLCGKTLMQVSDIHACHDSNQNFLIQSLIKAKRFDPHFVVYTGDYISLHNKQVPYGKLEQILSHCVKGSVGTAAILGNHDYGQGWAEPGVADNISTMIADKGIAVLRNEQQCFDGLNIIGFDEYWSHNFDPGLAMRGFNPDRANIALCHNPDVCDLNVWGSYDSWILSGHTHGGQVKPPFFSAPIIPVVNKRYTAGCFNLSNGRNLYINRALGQSLQVRFNVRPEITIFTLEAA